MPTELIDEAIILEADTFYLEDVPARFVIAYDTYEREPFTYGWRRGSYVEGTAELVSVQLGGFTANRDAVQQMIGKAALEAVEESVADAWTERREMAA